MTSINKQIFNLTIIIFFIFILGTIGFRYVENQTWLDSFWYTVMTLTTVGYGVPENFSNEGKIISIFLMLFGVGVVLYALSSLSVDIINGKFIKDYKQRKFKQKMKQLSNHVIICGFGRNGRQAARKLEQHGTQYVVVDKRELEVRNDEFKNVIFIKGDAIDEHTLIEAGIQKANGLIVALPSDADNLFIVISAKQLNPNLKIISRASNSNSVEKLKLAGASNVIMPDRIGGEQMASLLVTPDLVEFMDNIKLEGTKKINLLEISTSHLPEDSIGKQLKDLAIREKTGCSVIGYKYKMGSYIINPDDTQIIEKDSCLIVLGRAHQIEKLKELFLSN